MLLELKNNSLFNIEHSSIDVVKYIISFFKYWYRTTLHLDFKCTDAARAIQVNFFNQGALNQIFLGLLH